MARRRGRKSSRRRSFSGGARRIFSRRTGGGIVNTVKPMASGIGGGLIVETIANKVGFGQYGQMAGYAGAYLFGGIKGIAGKLGFDLLSGRGIGLGGIGQSSANTGISV
jgi:hypothetical protein